MPMPTPSDRATQLTGADPHLQRLTHTICPPDSERSGTRRREDEEGPILNDVVDGALSARPHDCAAAEIEPRGPAEDINHNHERLSAHTFSEADSNINNIDAEHSSTDGSSPISSAMESSTADTKDQSQSTTIAETVELSSSPFSRYEIPNIRVCLDHLCLRNCCE